MKRSKVHLVGRRGKAACGCIPSRSTQDPAEVDCYLCIRTVAMADAEARAEHDRRVRRTGHSPRKAGRQ